MRAVKIIGILILSFLTGYIGMLLGGLWSTEDAVGMSTGIIGFLVPSVCLIADIHSRP